MSDEPSTSTPPAPSHQGEASGVAGELRARFPGMQLAEQVTADGIPTLWLSRDDLRTVLRYLKTQARRPYRTLWDLAGIDERLRAHREGQPDSEFTVMYHLLSYDRNEDVRLKVPLGGDAPSVPTITDVWPAAAWYERELWDMFGVGVEGHAGLRRILMPPWWEGHPLRKEHPARGTELGPFVMSSA